MDAALAVSNTPLKFSEKLRVVAAAMTAALLMYYIGWMVARPTDPEMAVTMTLSGRSAWAIGPAMLVLAAVTAMIGSVIAGPRLPEAGMFAAGAGMGTLALRGGSMQMVLAYKAGTEAATRKALMMALALDTLLWALIAVAAWFAVTWAWKWLWAETTDDEALTGAPATTRTTGKSHASDLAKGWPALAVTAIVGLFVIWMTIARKPEAAIARGQVIASVAGGLFLGAMVARYFTGVNDACWYVLAPVGVALIGYLLGFLQADMNWANDYFRRLATTPPHALVRPLPVEYIGVGLAGALAGFWSGGRIEQAASEDAT